MIKIAGMVHLKLLHVIAFQYRFLQCNLMYSNSTELCRLCMRSGGWIVQNSSIFDCWHEVQCDSIDLRNNNNKEDGNGVCVILYFSMLWWIVRSSTKLPLPRLLLLSVHTSSSSWFKTGGIQAHSINVLTACKTHVSPKEYCNGCWSLLPRSVAVPGTRYYWTGIMQK